MSFGTSFILFWENLFAMMSGHMSTSTFGQQFRETNQYLVVVVIVLGLLMLAFLIATIVLANRTCKPK